MRFFSRLISVDGCDAEVDSDEVDMLRLLLVARVRVLDGTDASDCCVFIEEGIYNDKKKRISAQI